MAGYWCVPKDVDFVTIRMSPEEEWKDATSSWSRPLGINFVTDDIQNSFKNSFTKEGT